MWESLKENYELISTAKNDSATHSMSILRNWISFWIYVSEKPHISGYVSEKETYLDFSWISSFLTKGKYFVDILSK